MNEVESGKLIARRIVEPGLSTRLMVATASSRPLTQAVKIVQATLHEVLAAMTQAEPYRDSLRMCDE
jgi:LysR family nitrogen assimilation transcriptional regulator